VLPARAAWALALTIAGLGYGLDQLTKALALAHLDPGNPPVLLGGLLTLRLVRNPGAAFSLGGRFTVVLTGIAVVALAFVVGWLLPRTRHRGWVVAVGLLLGGILGNLTDRLVRPPGFAHGHVIDFLQLPYFAIFNVADMCITFAAVTIVWLSVVRQVGLQGESTREEAVR
jgi:signal peptidase II